MNVADNIARVGLEIDPTPAESGAKRGQAAAKMAEKAMHDVAKASDESNKKIADSTAKGGNAFMRMVDAARRMARGVQSAFSGIVSGATGMVRGITDGLGKIGLALDGLQRITAPLRGFLGGVFGKASEMEDFRFKWAYLLGSMDAAKKKMAELAQFANTTPFELPGVASASLKMASIKDAALEGMAGIKLIGDAAAKAGQPIEDVAERITRLVGSLKAGKGGGEPLTMLREWRVVSSEVAMQLSDLADDPKNYAKALELLVKELKTAEGSMRLQSTAWSGLTSTLSDAWGALQTAIGEPLLEGLKPLLIDATKNVDAMTARIKEWAPQIREFGIQISAAFKVVTGEGGLGLAMAAAADTFVEILKRGFEILGKMLQNIFDVVSHKFTKAMERIASYEFWESVGRALVDGVKKALAAMAGATDPVEQAMIDDMNRLGGDEFKWALERQQNPSLYGNLPSGLIAGRAQSDAQTIARVSEIQAYFQSRKSLPALDLTGGPELLMPWQIPGATDPLPQTANMQEFLRRQVEAAQEAERMSAGLIGDQNAILGASRGGAAENTLFPGGTVDLTEAAKAQKELATDAERWRKAVETPYESYQRTVAELEKMHALGAGAGGFTDEEYVRALTKAQEDYAKATEDAAAKQSEMHQKTLSEHQKLIQSWANLQKQVDQVTIGAANAITGNLSQALTDLVTGTKSAKEAFADMSTAIVNDILKMITQMLVQIAYAKILGWITGTPTGSVGSMIGTIAGGGNVLAGFRHEGGDVGQSNGRSIPIGIFAGAQRFHGGGVVGPDEVPIIAQRGETVLTREQGAKIRNRIMGAEEKAAAGVTIINVLDPNLVPDYHAKNPDAILNIMGPRMPQIRRMTAARAI